MQHLLVITHPCRQSFTHTVARVYARELEALGHETVIRDLYREHFDPVLGENELLDAKPRKIPSVVRREQRHLAAAGGVAFFYPIWWAFMPAMLKGYLDRVLSCGFAYDLEDEEMVPRLSGKKALIFTSSGADMSYLRKSKQWQSMRTLEKDHMLGLSGIELLEHVNFPSVTPGLPERIVAKHVERVRLMVQKHWGEIPAARG